MNNAHDLARQVADLTRRLAAVERTAQLPHSSVDNGAIQLTDADGTTVITLGLQDDGSYAVSGINGGQVVASDVLDGIVTDLALADAAVTAAAIAVGAVTTTAIADGSITTPKIVAGAIQAGQIAANSIDASKIVADTITGAQIAANAISAAELAANSVTAAAIAAGSIAADRLMVGGATGNIISDPSFESAAMRSARLAGTAGATQVPSTGWAFDTGSALARYDGTAFLSCSPDTTVNKKMYLTPELQTKAGEIFTGSVAVFASGSPAGSATLNCRVTKQDGSTSFPVIVTIASAAAAPGWTVFSGVVTMPANAKTVAFAVEADNHSTVGTWNFDLVEVRRTIPGVEIQDGTVTAAKLNATAIYGMTYQSPNYVTGVSGVHIDGATGAMEVGSLTARGNVIAGTDTSHGVSLLNTVPAELTTFYVTTRGLSITSAGYVRLASGTGVGYAYIIEGLKGSTLPIGNTHILAYGIVDSAGTVREMYQCSQFINSSGVATGLPQVSIGSPETPGATTNNGSLSVVGDLKVNLVSQGWGVVDSVVVTTTGAIQTGLTTETVLAKLTLSGQFNAGRVYRIVTEVFVTQTVTTDTFALNARLTNASGTLLVAGQDVGQQVYQLEGLWTPTTSGPQTICITLQRSAGTGTVGYNGSPGGSTCRTFALVQDIGDTSVMRTA